MTFILEMASGMEYQGEEFNCPNHLSAKSAPTVTAMDYEYPQLQLTAVEATASKNQPDSVIACIDIEALIKNDEN